VRELFSVALISTDAALDFALRRKKATIFFLRQEHRLFAIWANRNDSYFDAD
jgi:hypothetical protein